MGNATSSGLPACACDSLSDGVSSPVRPGNPADEAASAAISAVVAVLGQADAGSQTRLAGVLQAAGRSSGDVRAHSKSPCPLASRLTVVWYRCWRAWSAPRRSATAQRGSRERKGQPYAADWTLFLSSSRPRTARPEDGWMA